MAGRFIALVLGACLVAAAADPAIITTNDSHGRAVQLPNDRTPTLYTGDFSDCLGGESLFNITKFDTGYYADNSTIVIHIDGSTNLVVESLMLHLSIQAYGETRFETSIDPCAHRIGSLCPVDSATPIRAWTNLNVTTEDIHNITSISLNVPDFEGAATLRIFANSSHTEIGCLQAVLKNGRTFSHPRVIVPVLGVLTLVAIVSSFATAVYGFSIVHMRQHHSHTLSVLIVFETFQSIFFSGALSVSWPSVLPAWWTNFAWSVGIIHNRHLVDSMRSFVGIQGNGSQVGGAGPTVLAPGGGLIQKIYGRALEGPPLLHPRAHTAYKKNGPWDYAWAGNPETPGMPIPGTHPGFSGTLEPLGIPERDALLIGLIWLAVTVVAVAILVAVVKFVLDLLIKTNIFKSEGFNYFRSHLPGFVAIAVLRTLLIAFFTIITLALLQFNLKGPAGPTAIAAVVFVLFFLGMGGIVVYACHVRIREGQWRVQRSWLRFERGQIFGRAPFVTVKRVTALGEKATIQSALGHITLFQIRHVDRDPSWEGVYNDAAFIKRFGWLTAHYRRSKWWFFTLWFGYQVVRACFLGGGANNPLAQVFGLFLFETISFVLFWWLNPLEGRRNTVAAIWMLFASRIITVGLSIAFLPEFHVGRISATIIGIIIIVVQGFLAFVVLVLTLIGCVFSCLSLTRNRGDFPRTIDNVRITYFEHVAHTASDGMVRRPRRGTTGLEATTVTTIAANAPATASGASAASTSSTTDSSTAALTSPPSSPTQPRKAHFRIHSIRRSSNISESPPFNLNSLVNEDLPPMATRSRANSASSFLSTTSDCRHVARPSWTAGEISQWDAETRVDSTPPVPTAASGAIISGGHVQSRSRSSSLHMQAALRAQQNAAASTMSSPPGTRPLVAISSKDISLLSRSMMSPGELLTGAAARLSESPPTRIDEEEDQTESSTANKHVSFCPSSTSGRTTPNSMYEDGYDTPPQTMLTAPPMSASSVRPTLKIQTTALSARSTLKGQALGSTSGKQATAGAAATDLPPSPMSDAAARRSHEVQTPSPISPRSQVGADFGLY